MTLNEQAVAYDTTETIEAVLADAEDGSDLVELLIAKLIEDNPGTADAELLSELVDAHVSSPDREELHRLLSYWSGAIRAYEKLGLLKPATWMTSLTSERANLVSLLAPWRHH